MTINNAMIPRIDVAALMDQTHPDHAVMLSEARRGATQVGFLIVHNTPLLPAMLSEVFAAYRAFFHLSPAEKAKVDMAQTGANRGWGAARSEQVDPSSNPDYKQHFDCGYALAPDHSLSHLLVYAPNFWPDTPHRFKRVLQDYYRRALAFSLDLIDAIVMAIGQDGHYFKDKFTCPMALLRGNYYPQKSQIEQHDKDFGIAAHTDYGCLTLLATDGVAGLEVLTVDGGWTPVHAKFGDFVINFGEMFEMWTNGQIKATLHRVKSTPIERISVPLFVNPNHDTNVAPIGSGKVVLAADHLQKRFNETYLHLKK